MNAESIARALGNAKRSGGQWVCSCPAHEDSHASLSLSDTDDGGLLWKCHAGCDQVSVLDALRSRGLLEPERKERAELAWRICDTEGNLVAEHVRVDKPDGSKIVFWRPKLSDIGRKLGDMPLYRCHLIGEAAEVVVCEGEKAADAAARLGLVAVGTCCGASVTPGDGTLSILRGKAALLWPDNDDPGRAHMKNISVRLRALGVTHRTINWPDAPQKGDSADFVALGKTREDFTALLSAPVPTAPKRTKSFADGVVGATIELCRYAANDNSRRVPWGMDRLDRATRGGMRAGALYLLGAPSGHGKTTLIAEIAMHVAKERGTVILQSPEMELEELVEREIIRRSGIPLFNRHLSMPGETRRIAAEAHAAAAIDLQQNPPRIEVVTDIGVEISELSDIAAGIPDLALVIIDYAQEVATKDPRLLRRLAVGKVGIDAIELGRRCNVPVLVASQVMVGKEDLVEEDRYTFKETGDLHEKAHLSMILAITRKKQPNEHGYRDIESAKIFSKKNRSGPPFTFFLNYQPELYSITEIDGPKKGELKEYPTEAPCYTEAKEEY